MSQEHDSRMMETLQRIRKLEAELKQERTVFQELAASVAGNASGTPLPVAPKPYIGDGTRGGLGSRNGTVGAQIIALAETMPSGFELRDMLKQIRANGHPKFKEANLRVYLSKLTSAGKLVRDRPGHYLPRRKA